MAGFRADWLDREFSRCFGIEEAGEGAGAAPGNLLVAVVKAWRKTVTAMRISESH